MGRYCYSREIDTIEGKETFAIVEAASFDEAKKEVDKGIRDRRLELADKHFDVHISAETVSSAVGLKDNVPVTASDAPANLPDSLNKFTRGEEGKDQRGAS